MSTLETRAAFAKHVADNNLLKPSLVSRFHKMLDGTATKEELLPDTLWNAVSDEFRMFLFDRLS